MAPKHPLETMTKAERMHYMFGMDALSMMEHDIHDMFWEHRGCPRAWHTIAENEDRRDTRRIRCTVGFDADVVKFFKAMGPGYQHRMNRVLRAFMHLRLAKIIKGPDTSDYIMRPEEVIRRFCERRPDWGDALIRSEELRERRAAREAEGCGVVRASTHPTDVVCNE